MVWATSNRKAELPDNWAALRKAVKSRAKGKCEWPGCKAYGSECDHKVDRDDHRIQSLAWLCSYHHRLKTQRESQQARGLLGRNREPEKHPGLKPT